MAPLWWALGVKTALGNGTTACAGNSADGPGAAYVYGLVRSGISRAQKAHLKTPNAENQDNFGSSAGMEGPTTAAPTKKTGVQWAGIALRGRAPNKPFKLIAIEWSAHHGPFNQTRVGLGLSRSPSAAGLGMNPIGSCYF